MKRLAVKDQNACTECHACEEACSQAYYKQVDIALSCLHVLAGGRIASCTQCGSCAEVCPVEAIAPNKQGVYMIDKKLCVGCLACYDICPEQAIVKSPDSTNASKCVACGLCVKACPEGVLEIVKD